MVANPSIGRRISVLCFLFFFPAEAEVDINAHLRLAISGSSCDALFIFEARRGGGQGIGTSLLEM
jgi:hypothetical protein